MNRGSSKTLTSCFTQKTLDLFALFIWYYNNHPQSVSSDPGLWPCVEVPACFGPAFQATQLQRLATCSSKCFRFSLLLYPTYPTQGANSKILHWYADMMIYDDIRWYMMIWDMICFIRIHLIIKFLYLLFVYCSYLYASFAWVWLYAGRYFLRKASRCQAAEPLGQVMSWHLLRPSLSWKRRTLCCLWKLASNLFQLSLRAMSILCRMNMSERYSSSIWSDAYFDDGRIVRITHSNLHIYSYLLRQRLYSIVVVACIFGLCFLSWCRQPWKTAMALRHQEPLPSRPKPQSANRWTKCFWFWVFFPWLIWDKACWNLTP